MAPTGEAAIQTRVIVLKLLEVLKLNSYSIHASIDTEPIVLAPDAWVFLLGNRLGA